jgi:hypothetical protein
MGYCFDEPWILEYSIWRRAQVAKFTCQLVDQFKKRLSLFISGELLLFSSLLQACMGQLELTAPLGSHLLGAVPDDA